MPLSAIRRFFTGAAASFSPRLPDDITTSPRTARLDPTLLPFDNDGRQATTAILRAYHVPDHRGWRLCEYFTDIADEQKIHEDTPHPLWVLARLAAYELKTIETAAFGTSSRPGPGRHYKDACISDKQLLTDATAVLLREHRGDPEHILNIMGRVSWQDLHCISSHDISQTDRNALIRLKRLRDDGAAQNMATHAEQEYQKFLTQKNRSCGPATLCATPPLQG